MYGYNENYFGMHFFWWVFWLILVLVVAYLLNRKSQKSTDTTPLEILKKRFAKGEITKEEFEKSKEALKN